MEGVALHEILTKVNELLPQALVLGLHGVPALWRSGQQAA